MNAFKAGLYSIIFVIILDILLKISGHLHIWTAQIAGGLQIIFYNALRDFPYLEKREL